MRERLIDGTYILCCRPAEKLKNVYSVSVTLSELVLFNNLKNFSILLK